MKPSTYFEPFFSATGELYKKKIINFKDSSLSPVQTDCSKMLFVLQQGQSGEIQMLETEFSGRQQDKLEMYLQNRDSIPALLSSITLDLFNQQTINMGWLGTRRRWQLECFERNLVLSPSLQRLQTQIHWDMIILWCMAIKWTEDEICHQNGSHLIIIIIIMYIYCAFINALSAHMIHINLNLIFYTHVEHSPTKTIYIIYYMEKQTLTTHTHTHTHTHTDCSFTDAA